MADQADIEHMQELLEIYRRRLHILELQAAQYGVHTAPHIILEIEDTRQQIQRLSSSLQGADPDERAQEPFNFLRAYQQACAAQARTYKAHLITPELHTFADEICRVLNFAIIPESFHVHHGIFASLRVKAPTLHLNLPTQFPIIILLDQSQTSDRLADIVKHLSNMLDMLDGATDFGLVFVPKLHPHVQLMVNKLIRPALKNDLIVLGESFLKNLGITTNPKNLLLNEILREVDLTRISPFMAGGANLSDRMFFGREGEIKNIAENITKTSIAITCGRRMGKTTLLNRLAQVVLPTRDHQCFFLNCQPVHDYQEFLTEMMGVWKLPDMPFNPSQPQSFAHLVHVLTENYGKPPIFLFDEVDELLKYDSQNQQRLFKQLRALSMDGRAHFIMTGERSVQLHLHDANSPLFNFFGFNLKLSFLDLPSVNKLVVEPLSDMQLDLRDPTPMLDTIFNATSGHPYLVQRLCQGLVQAISRQGRRIIGPEHIELVLNDSAYQQDYFETVLGQSPLLARVITKLPNLEGVTMRHIQSMLAQHELKPSLSEISAALDVLDLYSVLQRRAGRYYFLSLIHI